MLWEIDISPRSGHPDLEGPRVSSDAADMGIAEGLLVHAVRGYLVQGDIDRDQMQTLAD